jgi:ABC-type transport system substrate-binding protein
MRYTWIGIVLLCNTAVIILVPPLVSSRPNAPYPEDESDLKVRYLPLGYEPRHLDPAHSYSSGESVLLAQVYEPAFQYHYLKRPYVLQPLTCREVPEPQFFDSKGNVLPPNANPEQVARVSYEFHVKEGIRYHPHPCFAKNADGSYAYRNLKEDALKGIETPNDFPSKDTREVVAADHVHQIKRLCIPNLVKPCPILSTLSKYIDGMEEYAEALQQELDEIRAKREREQGAAYIQQIDERENPILFDLDKYPLPGVELVDRHTFRIHLKKPYPQLLYWMAMAFFAPMPPEATAFYEQAPLIDRNITLDRYPVGTGPFRFDVYKPNRLITFVRNPDYHEDYYPTEGEPTDRELGFLDAADQRLPFLDKLVYFREREGVPTWIKFLQGYYDFSGIGTTNFDQGVKFSGELEAAEVGDALRDKGISLTTQKSLSVFYYGFNMLDPVFGGYGEKKQKLRQAIAIAMDTEEYLQVFANGMGNELHGPVPEGIFGYTSGPEGINPYVFDWDEETGRPVRKSLDYARKLLAEAGYPGGIGNDGKQLIVYFDNASTGGAADAYFRWLHRQFAKLNIVVVNRTTDGSSFVKKADEGKLQMFGWGWLLDYPDPENFLFLLYGPNSRAKFHGENSANYQNPEYDRLFLRMLAMPNSPERQEVIDQMNAILHRDLPWFSIRQQAAFTLKHDWMKNSKVSAITKCAKYLDIDVASRDAYRRENNRPLRWPIYTLAALILLVALPALGRRIRKERS